MPNEKREKFAPPPPNVVIRTLEKDLEALRTGGGTIIPPLPQEVAAPQPSQEEAFLYQRVPGREPSSPAVPQPPRLEPTPPETPPGLQAPSAPQGQAEAVSVPPLVAPPEKSKLFSAIVITSLVVLGLVGLASVGYFAIWPRVSSIFQATPTPLSPPPSPSPILSPSPSPSPVNPSLLLVTPPQVSAEIVLAKNTRDMLLLSLSEERAKKESPGIVKALALRAPEDRYLTAGEFILLAVQNPYPSFTTAIGEKYLPFLYYGKSNSYFGFALEIISGKKGDVEELLKSWEGAAMDQDFSLMFLGDEPGKRKTETFRAVMSGGVLIREVSYQNDELMLAYTFVNNILVVATHREAVLALIKKL